MTPHAFRPIKPGSNRCSECGGWADAGYHSLELFTDADRERQAAREIEEVREMEARMRTAKDVSLATGILERESPLFWGKGDSPCLF